ncbi:ARID DNA-binding domain-containing protein [Tanacetum coccineum]
MQKPSYNSGKWQRPLNYSYGQNNKWHQSENLGRPPRRIVQTEFIQRKNKRDKEERFGKCMREITRDCREMLRKKLEEIEAYNSSKTENKMIHYNCFYCNTDGHISRTCPSKIKDDALGITQNNTIQSSVSLKYPDFIHFKTREIVKGTDEGTWDDYWIEGQKKFLFTYGIGEVIINNEKSGCMIPGVHYAPESTLNILSIDLLRQQGFELLFDGGKCTLEYMFKTKLGRKLDVDKMKQMHNDYLDDYFESLDKDRIEKEAEKERPLEVIEEPEVHNFHGFVDFLNLIKSDNIDNREWDTYRSRFEKVLEWFYKNYLKRELPGKIPPTIDGITIHLFDLYKLMETMGGYLSVHFGLEFGVIAEILGLTRSDGEKIRKCYETYLGVLVSHYKTARAPPPDPIQKEDGSESLEEYDWKLEEKVATEAARKGKEKIEHFGILLEGEGEHKQSESAQKEKESLTKCYKCQDYGHYAFECPLKNKKKIQDMYASYNNSAPKIEEGMDSNSISSEDFYIIT